MLFCAAFLGSDHRGADGRRLRRAGPSRGFDVALDVRREHVVRVEIRNHRLPRRCPRKARGAVHERALVQADDAAIAARFELAADVLVDRRATRYVPRGAGACGLIARAREHPWVACVTGRLAVRPITKELVVDPVEQQQVLLMRLQRGLERRQFPIARIGSRGRTSC